MRILQTYVGNNHCLERWFHKFWFPERKRGRDQLFHRQCPGYLKIRARSVASFPTLIFSFSHWHIFAYIIFLSLLCSDSKWHHHTIFALFLSILTFAYSYSLDIFYGTPSVNISPDLNESALYILFCVWSFSTILMLFPDKLPYLDANSVPFSLIIFFA